MLSGHHSPVRCNDSYFSIFQDCPDDNELSEDDLKLMRDVNFGLSNDKNVKLAEGNNPLNKLHSNGNSSAPNDNNWGLANLFPMKQQYQVDCDWNESGKYFASSNEKDRKILENFSKTLLKLNFEHKILEKK